MDEPQEAKPRFSTEYNTTPPPKWKIPLPPLKFWLALGVVAMLVGMLMPALRVAREKARRVTCMCNLKQIGLAMRLYSGDNKEKFPCDPEVTVLGSYALLTNGYQTAQKTWMCPSDRGVSGCGSAIPSFRAVNPFQPNQMSYAYGGFGLKETAQPDSPIACDRTSGDVRSAWPYVNNQWTHKTDGGMVLFADGHVVWQKKFDPPMYRGKNP